MVKEINAGGTNYIDFLNREGMPSDGFVSLPFYLDGNDKIGELDLPMLVNSLAILTQNPNFDPVSWRINETADPDGRQAIVLHVPRASLPVLGIDVSTNTPKVYKLNSGDLASEPSEPANDENKPEKDPYEGRRYFVRATRTGDSGAIFEFLALIEHGDPEEIEAKAIAKARTMMNSFQAAIAVDPIPMDRQSFEHHAKRMASAGHPLPLEVIESSPVISEHVRKIEEGKRRKARNYR